MNTEAAIAQATEASRNKHADPMVAAAYARLIAAVIQNGPPAFDLFPTTDEFEDAPKGLDAIALALGEYVRAVAVEAQCNATRIIEVPDATLFVNALHDSDLPATLRLAAEQMREDEREVA